MKKEGEMWIAREGIYRMNLGCLYVINCHGPSQEVLDTIHSVNIRIKGAQYLTTSTDAEHPELQVLDDLAGSAFLHKTCNISLELDEPLLYLGNVILNRLERLDGFEKVVLRVWTKWTGEPEITNFPKMYKAFEILLNRLKPFLGETNLRSDEPGWSMVFYPHKAQKGAPTAGSGGNTDT